MNALRYGLNAADVVIPGEDPVEFEFLQMEMETTFGPITSLEFDLVSEMAAARWRLRRITIMEKAAWEAAFRRVRGMPGNEGLSGEELYTIAVNEVTNGPEMKQVHRHETRLRRVWEKARLEVVALITDRLRAERDAKHAAFAANVVADAKAQVAASQAAWEAKQQKLASERDRQQSGKPSRQPETAPVQNEPSQPPAARAA
ncbi:MAG: hypothetical protein SGI92_22705 [Bryobacteraceae bacterium]|nr:hypothetical protein [Bryobacteraceae bacterium]